MDDRTLQPEPRAQRALDLLRERGERVTRARRAVLAVLDDTAEHLNADEIAERASAGAPGVHRATVYRALSTLGDLGMVAHTRVGGSAAVYHLSVAGDGHPHLHAHVHCTVCGTVIDVPADALAPLTRRLRRDLGFRVEPQQAALLGTCASCLDGAPPA